MIYNKHLTLPLLLLSSVFLVGCQKNQSTDSKSTADNDLNLMSEAPLESLEDPPFKVTQRIKSEPIASSRRAAKSNKTIKTAAKRSGSEILKDPNSIIAETITPMERAAPTDKILETVAKAPVFEILEDMSSIIIVPGTPSPKIGDRLYSMSSLPDDKCGEFWVKNTDGTVMMIAVCTGNHEGGH